jgi:hypothetical protein
MKVKILLISFIMIFTISFVVSKEDYASVNLPILVNAEALASECNPGEVMGSKYTVTCNTPTDNKGNKCSYSVVTCQGTAGCCTRDYCKDHM